MVTCDIFPANILGRHIHKYLRLTPLWNNQNAYDVEG